ncbi:uncharacterized protein LOC125555722 [Triticum urartu]|uniref:uncharacterized protein LOC125555722 n=1 Tax=Triticum urartu TaxID=4572 RepID=UPI0020437DC3|nr:uncharacterized protein LOC125555722 [Triticum urartu]
MATVPSGDVEGGCDDSSRSGRGRRRNLLDVDFGSSSSSSDENGPLLPCCMHKACAEAAAAPAATGGSRSIEDEGAEGQSDRDEPSSLCRVHKACAAVAARAPAAAPVLLTNVDGEAPTYNLSVVELSGVRHSY